MAGKKTRAKTDGRKRKWGWGKRLGAAFAAVFALFVLIVLLIPLWLPWVAAPVAERFGVGWERYERIGYARFAVHDVRFEEENVLFEAGRIEGRTPLRWLWRGLFPRDEEELSARIDRWRLRIEPRDEPDPDADDVSVYEIFHNIDKYIETVIRWFPRAQAGEGVVQFEEHEIEVRVAEWNRGLLTAEVHEPRLAQTLVFQGDVREGSPYVFTAALDPFPFETRVVVAVREDGIEAESETFIAGNRVEASAAFPSEGYLPAEAFFRSENFRVPREYFDVEGYEEITGTAIVFWRDDAFSVEIDGEARPLSDDETLPAIRVKAEARGDLEGIRVEALEATSPWLVASLSHPVVLDYAGGMLSEYSVFRVEADLGAQPFVELAGEVAGEIRLWRGEAIFPEAEFALEGSGIAGFDVAVSRLDVRGGLSWPLLTVERLEVETPGEAPSMVSATGRIDLEAGEIVEGEARGTVSEPAVAVWLPEGIGFREIDFSFEASGDWAGPRHRGEVSVIGAQVPTLPHAIDARLQWNGDLAAIERFELATSAGEIRIEGSGAIEVADGFTRFDASIGELSVFRAGELELALERTVLLELDFSDEFPRIALRDFEWHGPGGHLRAAASAQWPVSGEAEIDLQTFDTRLLQDLLEVDLERLMLDAVRFSSRWEDGGPLEVAAASDVRVRLDDRRTVRVEARVEADGDGVRIERLRGGTEGQLFVRAEGRLPVVLYPGREESPLEIDIDGEINVFAQTEPFEEFWEAIGQMAGVRLTDPNVYLRVSGTPARPEGEVRAVVRQIGLAEEVNGIAPRIDDLDIVIGLDPDRIYVRRGLVFLENQRIEAFGELVMGAEAWANLVLEREMPDWRDATGRVVIDGASIASLARYFPALLSPQGTLSLDIELREAGIFGSLDIDGAATRPLLPLGVVEDASARVRFTGWEAEVETIRGILGGEEAVITGRITLPVEQPLGFDLSLRGSNLPLTRQPGLIVRGDLDLRIAGTLGEPATISGDVRLRESFYLAHLRLMPTGAVATPARRPPFFSIEHEPINSWRLDVNLRGPQFLNVRGPIFQGGVSAFFRLGGTLEEPVALGDVTIDTGTIRFPFATMQIDQGIVSLRRENPYQPQLFVIASSKSFGYDVRMEVSGTAERPVIEFSSTPPLTSEQAMLMVTTGEIPMDEFGYTAQQRASRFAFYLGQNLLYEITGDDRAGERLEVRSGEEISEQGRETYKIEYRLTNRWSLTGEYNRFDEYTAGFKWNIYSR